ncbi:MAG: ribosome small subunit-dependent GTPase A, partial [Phycisphaerae bacterium]
REDDVEIEDTSRVESVRPKGELSRKRTVIENQEDADAADESTWIAGTVTRIHGLYCYVDEADGTTWECTVRRVLRTRAIEGRNAVIVGDRVRVAPTSAPGETPRVGVIERVAPRSSELSRRDRRGKAHTIVANSDQLLIVASVAQPGLKPHLIDRYIVAALKGKLTPVICFNKMDLAPADDRIVEELEEMADCDGVSTPLTIHAIIAEFRTLGYHCLETSAATGEGVAALRDAIHGHTSVLSGQSGVGKSTLLNAVQPGLALVTSAVSEDNEKGRHTTTHAQLIRLEGGGFVVDTPGIRAFELWDVVPGELEAYFVEFGRFLQHCHFNDCMHYQEEKCAVRDAAEAGTISMRRYLSYTKMLEDSQPVR